MLHFGRHGIDSLTSLFPDWRNKFGSITGTKHPNLSAYTICFANMQTQIRKFIDNAVYMQSGETFADLLVSCRKKWNKAKIYNEPRKPYAVVRSMKNKKKSRTNIHVPHVLNWVHVCI